MAMFNNQMVYIYIYIYDDDDDDDDDDDFPFQTSIIQTPGPPISSQDLDTTEVSLTSLGAC